MFERSRWSQLVVAVLVSVALVAVWSDSTSAAPPDISKLKVGDSVRIEKRGGGVIEGSVSAVDAKHVTVKTKFGNLKVKRDDIEKVDRVKTPEELYDERAKTAKTADDWLAIGDFMEKQNEFELAERAFKKCIEIDSEHVEGRKRLGQVKHEGKWLPEDEAMLAKGFVKYKGEWVTKEELAKRKADEKKRLEDQKQKGQRELELEYLGRPYAEVNPEVSEHFEVWCYSTEAVAKEYTEFLEAMYDRYDTVFKKFKRYKGGRGRVTIYANQQQFIDWEVIEQGVGGFYQPWTGNVFAYHGSFGTTGSTYEVLAHEGTHQFQGFILKNFRSCPTWVIEGMAVFFGDGSEYERGKVKIGIIPRDRLVGVQRSIENGSYPPVEALIRLPHRAFSGFFYGHGWGLVYWSLWGKRAPVKAPDADVAMEVFVEFFEPIAKSNEVADLNKLGNKYTRLIETKTGKSLSEWEEDYKDWLMQLPVEKLMKRKSGGWYESEKLGFRVKKPSGWKNEKELRRLEQIAFASKGSRISTRVWSNFQRASLSTTLLENFIRNSYNEVNYDGDGLLEPTQKSVGGFQAIEAVFEGVPRVSQESNSGQQAGESSSSDGDAGEKVKVRVVLYATVDKVRTNLLESPTSEFGQANDRHFQKYLENFEQD